MIDYRLCGWRVSSAVPLPEAPPWTGDDRPADISIGFGEVPERLDDILGELPFVQVARDGHCLLEVAAIGRFLMSAGCRITIAAGSDADSAAIRMILLGSALGILAHQRHFMPLHASCVQIGDGVVAFAGQSGDGKSTLAAALARRGYQMMADDVCVIDVGTARGPMVRPAFSRVKLWQDSIEAMGIPAERLEAVRLGQNKFNYRFDMPADFGIAFPRLRGIYFLTEALPDKAESIDPIAANRAAVYIFKHVFRPQIGHLLGRDPKLLLDAALIAETVPSFWLRRSKDLSQLAGLVDLVVRECA